MTNIRESILRHSLKPRVESDLPGRLRILFPQYPLLPDAARPYLHYAEDVLKLLPGVLTVRINLRIGTVLILYDQAVCAAPQILKWIDIALDTGIKAAGEIELLGIKEEGKIASLVRKRLILQIQQCKNLRKAGRKSE